MYKGKIITLMGLGGYEQGSGVSAAMFLAPQCKKMIITDRKSKEDLADNVAALSKFKNIVWHLGGHKKEDFTKTDWVIRNPGVRADNEFLQLARKNKIPIDNDVTLFIREIGGPKNIIGVTGTRGKTTTSHLIHEMLKEENLKALLGGNVGESPLNWLVPERSAAKSRGGPALPFDRLRVNCSVPIVLELSSFLLHDFATIEQSPHIAVWTTLYPDHLNAYPSMSSYVADKKNIYKFQTEDDFLILNDDDERLRKLSPKTPGAVIRFSTRRRLKDGCFIAGGKVFFGRDGVCSTRDFHLPGKHNLANLLAAICAAKVYGISNANIKQAVKSFRGVPYRLETIRRLEGVQYINDTTATTPEGAIAGLHAYPPGHVILITGGNSKGLSLKEFSRQIQERAKLVIKLPGNANGKLPSGVDAADMKEAVTLAAEHARRGDVVLLSPGLSWLPVMNEFERGDVFNEEVGKL